MRAASFKSLYQKRPLRVCRYALLRDGRSRYSTKTFGSRELDSVSDRELEGHFAVDTDVG
jgi:hypothetical protein